MITKNHPIFAGFRMFATAVVVTLGCTVSEAAPGARAWEEPIVIPTYRTGQPDRCPLFVEHRANQGAFAPVYPYPMLDALTGVRVNETYRAVYLENPYVQICVLPELGGRILFARDKTNSYDFIYRQHVIKPALIGILGAWISGGVEWNIPHHHRATTFMPVSWAVVNHEDGSATVRVGELELRDRMRWVVELTLRPDSACVEQSVRLINRTPLANSFLYFANFAVHANRDYQVIFPPDVQWVTNHGKREFSAWPVSRSVYNGTDFTRGVDVSWWKNHPGSTSMFVWRSAMDFLAGYDHGRGAGFVHVADHLRAPGKKFFTWGGGEDGQMWDRALTDADGPYIELMAGSYSNNQPDYSWIQPYQTKSAEEFWYPIPAIGGVKNANREAAVNLEIAQGTARMAVAVTREQPRLSISLAGAKGTLLERNAAVAPGKPFKAECHVPPDAGHLTLRVRNDRGELISYRAVATPPTTDPEVVTPPARPGSFKSVEELYLTGLRLEQQHSAALDPEDYYREALRRDPGDSRTNTAMGVRYLRRAMFPEAEARFRTAVQRAMPGYIHPKDGEALYHLGLALRAQGKTAAAVDAFAQAAWTYGWDSAASYQLAEIASAQGDWAGGLGYVERSLAANSENLKALGLKAALLRKLGRTGEAGVALTAAASLDPLDPWPAFERSGATSLTALGEGVQGYLEAATDYMNAGMWEEASGVLAGLDGKQAAHPMVLYYRGYLAQQARKPAEAAQFYAQAARSSPEYCFPFRVESLALLRAAQQHNPADARAPYYLGNLLMFFGQTEGAIREWEQARKLDPAYAMVHRNLAAAYARAESSGPKPSPAWRLPSRAIRTSRAIFWNSTN